MKSSKGQGVCGACEKGPQSLGGVLGAFGRFRRSFSLIFSLSFLTSIFHNFFLGFGEVLGDPNGSQIEIFVTF